jgi:hypothetical protein
MKEESQEVTKAMENEETKMPTTDTEATKTSGSVLTGSMLAILTIVLVIVLVALYYWFTLLNISNTPIVVSPSDRPTAEENNEPESTVAESEVEMLNTALSPSDELDAITADLAATNVDGLEEELEVLETELTNSLNN